jgi:hydrogenase maturation protease
MSVARRAGRGSPAVWLSTLIVGLGNPLRGDDGVGCRLVTELATRDLPPEVEVLDGGMAGLGLLDIMEGWERVVVVDAADVGQEPGTYVRFAPADARLVPAADRFSFHHAGLGEVLALASALDRSLPELVVFGVQPAGVGWGQGLSAAVESVLPALADAVLAELRGEDYAQDPGD